MGRTSEESALASAWPVVATAIGIVLIVIGLAWPSVANSSGSVTEEQAEEYYAASTALEKAAASQSRQQRRGRQPSKQGLDAARERFDKVKQEVVATKTDRAKLAFWLKLTGGVLAMVGAGGLLMRQSDE